MFKLLESNMKTAYQKVIAKRDLRCNLIRPSIYRVLWSINNDTPKSFLYEWDIYIFRFESWLLSIFVSLDFSIRKYNSYILISSKINLSQIHIQYVNIIYFIKSDWGWNEGNKKAELFEEAAWWVLILFLTILKHSDKQYLQVLDCAEWWWNSHCLFPLQVKYEDFCSNVIEEKLMIDNY